MQNENVCVPGNVSSAYSAETSKVEKAENLHFEYTLKLFSYKEMALLNSSLFSS